MFALISIIALVLCVWGGCLVARVIANRIELGTRNTVQGKDDSPAIDAAPATTAAKPTPVRRSAWWSVAGVASLLIGAGVAFLGSMVSADLESIDTGRTVHLGDSVTDALFIASAGLAAGLCVMGWRIDPARGRRRCPKCWYDLAGVNGRLCPECGHEAKSERELGRSRRSGRMLILAAIVLLSGPISSRVNMTLRYGAWGLVPTTAMIVAWEWMPQELLVSDGVDGSLHQRLENKELARWQVRLLRWEYLRPVRTSNDPHLMVRAAALAEEAYYTTFDGETWNAGIHASLSNRLDFLIECLKSGDDRRRQAMISLIDEYTGGLNTIVLSSGKEAPEYSSLLLSVIDSGRPDASCVALDALLYLEFVPDDVAISRLEPLLHDGAMVRGCGYSMLGVFAMAQTNMERVRVVYLTALSAHDPDTRGALLAQSEALLDDPVIRSRILESLRLDDPAVVGGAALALQYYREYQPLVLRTITERIGRNPKEIEHFMGVLTELGTWGQPEENRKAFVNEALPSLLIGLEVGSATTAAQALSLLSAHDAKRPEVLTALRSLLTRPDLPFSLRQGAMATLKLLFPNERAGENGPQMNEPPSE